MRPPPLTASTVRNGEAVNPMIKHSTSSPFESNDQLNFPYLENWSSCAKMSLAPFPSLNSPRPQWSSPLPRLVGNKGLHPFSISTSLFTLAFIAQMLWEILPNISQSAKHSELWSSDPWLIHLSLYFDEPATWLSGYLTPSSDFYAVSKHSDIFQISPQISTHLNNYHFLL